MQLSIDSTITINNGHQIPRLGLGTYLASGSSVKDAVKYALAFGYKHIDTAAFYGNEQEIGEAIKETDIQREELFITTKLWNDSHGYDEALRAFDESLQKLNTEYVDLYLIHWPLEGKRKQTWKALEKIYEEGRAKSIGVSNYLIRHLKELFTYANTIPAVNQVEFSPFNFQKKLLKFCKNNNILLEAYSPLMKGRNLDDKVLTMISEHYKRTTAQILIRWALQHNTVVIPKSANKERIMENASVYDFSINDDDMMLLNAQNKNFRVSWDPSDIP